MKNFYELLNVTSDMQLENLMEKLDLTTDEMVFLSSISDNVMLSLNDKRKRVMEMMSVNAHNYNIMKEQYLKPTNRVMKENNNDTNVNMNDIIELNDFIQSVYKKCSTDKKALKRIYDYLMKHTSKNITKEILTIIRNASSNDELKINPSVVVDGQKITDILMSIKNDIDNIIKTSSNLDLDENKKSYSVNESNNCCNTTNLGNKCKNKKKFNQTEEVDETCSSGSTCAGSVGMIGKPFKTNKKMNVSETVFLNMILDNQDVSQNIKGDNYRFTNGYLYKNGNIVKTKNRQKMVEFVLGNIDLPTLEGVLPMHLDILMEDEEETVNYDDLTPEQKEEKKKREDELSQKMSGNMEVDVSVENKDDSMKIDTDQKLIGVDDSDEKNKKYIIKNPSNNEIRLVDSSKIKMENYRGKYVRK